MNSKYKNDVNLGIDKPMSSSHSLLFFQFYKKYNTQQNTMFYHVFDSNKTIIKLIQKSKSSAKIVIDGDIVEMYFNTDSSDLRSILVFIGYYFNKYDSNKRCVYIDDPKLIIKLFEQGILKFKELKFDVQLPLDKIDLKEIIKILNKGRKIDATLFKKLSENFSEILNESWSDYYNRIKEQYDKDVEDMRLEALTLQEMPVDWTNLYANDARADGVFAEDAADGLILSLGNLSCVDIEYISQITGLDCKTVIADLKGIIYQNPETWEECFYKGWETTDEYLSGAVVDKWRSAVIANKKYKGYFQRNVDALEPLIPDTVDENDIYVTLGSPWIPTDVIDDFVIYLFGGDWAMWMKDRSPERQTKHDVKSGIWELPKAWLQDYSFANTFAYGTNYVKGAKLIEYALNMRIPTVTKQVEYDNKVKSVVIESETLLAREKQKKIIKEFQEWVWRDSARKNRLVGIYNSIYCSYAIRQYNGNFLKFPNMNTEVELYDYQRDAIARIMLSPNTLLAHDVGAGKTYVMIAAGMEKKRIGVSNKNLYVVPNNLVGQWEEAFKYLYPNINLLVITPTKFGPSKRSKVLEDIRDNDYDAILMPYSSFGLIGLSKGFYVNKINEEIKVIRDRLKVVKKNSKDYQKKIQKLTEEKEKLERRLLTKDDNIYFDELGINSLFIDEAHNYKNLPIETQSNKISGLSFTGSAKCEDMRDKVYFVQKNNNGGGVVFATGTPITNSLTDIYVMQKYLQNGILSTLSLQSFDSWIANFAEKELNFEVDVDTNNYRMITKFTKFHNIPELSTILAMVTDFHMVDKTVGIPQLDSYANVTIPKTKELNKYLDEISLRAEKIRNRKVKRKDDNMLKITTDGRKAALDIRLVNPKAKFSFESKVYQCANNVYEIYHKTSEKKLTQIVFCDMSTPKKEFNVYDSLKDTLIMMGIPSSEIAFIHDATSEKERNDLFKEVRKGDIRILIGSTQKLGLGVNVQDKLVALHHLDLPWRPADMIQREGRILRKGNENEEIEIYRYITDGSFDAYSWQILESKQRIIRGLLSGSIPKRMCDEIDDVVLSYAEVKALAIGNPLLKERVERSNELSKLYTLQRKFIENHQRLEVELNEIPFKIERIQKYLSESILDYEFYEENKQKYETEERIDLRRKIFKALIDFNDEDKETVEIVCTYQGFDVVVPKNITKEKWFVYLEKNGRHTIDMGDSEQGIIVRLDNFLEGFNKHIKKLQNELDELMLRKKHIIKELEKKDSYSKDIEKLHKELEEIDTRLGVNRE